MTRFRQGGCLFLLALSGCASGGGEQLQSKKAAQWDYCFLDLSRIGKTCSFSSSEDVVAGEGVVQLAEKLGVRNVDARSMPARVVEAKILNHLGSQGWEMVSAVSDTHLVGQMTFYFKKRRQ